MLEKLKQKVMQDKNVLELDANEHFGLQLKKKRKLKKLTLEEVGKIMGCHLSNVSHFERGYNNHKGHGETRHGSFQGVFNYAKALGYNVVEFNL